RTGDVLLQDLRDRAQPATAGAPRRARGPVGSRLGGRRLRRGGPLVDPRLAPVARKHDRRRDLRDPAQHHRQARSRSARVMHMDLVLTEDQAMLANTAREFFSGTSGLARLRRLRDGNEPLAYSPDVWAKMVELGFLSMPFSEEDGGLGL